jgi:hypothetical protein
MPQSLLIMAQQIFMHGSLTKGNALYRWFSNSFVLYLKFVHGIYCQMHKERVNQIYSTALE